MGTRKKNNAPEVHITNFQYMKIKTFFYITCDSTKITAKNAPAKPQRYFYRNENEKQKEENNILRIYEQTTAVC